MKTIIIILSTIILTACGGQIDYQPDGLQFSEDINQFQMDHYESPRNACLSDDSPV